MPLWCIVPELESIADNADNDMQPITNGIVIHQVQKIFYYKISPRKSDLQSHSPHSFHKTQVCAILDEIRFRLLKHEEDTSCVGLILYGCIYKHTLTNNL